MRFCELFASLPQRLLDGDAAIAAVWQLAKERQEQRRREQAEEMAQVLTEFDALLRGIAAVAEGDNGPRTDIEQALPKLEENGWQLAEATQRIWDGERDAAALTVGVDGNSAQLIRRVLELIANEDLTGLQRPVRSDQPDPAAVLTAMPADIRAAFDLDGEEFSQALGAALAALPEEEADRIVQQLRNAGLIG